MQALILAGGFGTRLRPLTIKIPKSVVPIGNQPFLLTQIKLLKAAGVTDIILSLNYHPSAIEKILGNGAEYGVNLKYLVEPVPLGTAGAYKFAGKFLKTTTIVLNGDILTDVDLPAVIAQHKKHHSTATIVLTKVENPAAYGLVETGADGRVLRFLEKPVPDEINRLKINTINAGIYILEPKILEYIAENKNYSFEYNLFPDLLQKKENFRAFAANDDYWLDIGTHQRYLQAHQDLIAGRIKNFQVDQNNNFKISKAAAIDSASLIADGCVIKAGAKIFNSVLGKNVIVEKEATVQNSVIWAGTKIGSSAEISNSIICNDCRIGKNVSVGDGSVLGDKTILTDFTCLLSRD
ncbi:MAG: sugar phosphate nucleotidyltransferase [Pyrinomonadaceae bacterium]